MDVGLVRELQLASECKTKTQTSRDDAIREFVTLNFASQRQHGDMQVGEMEG